MTALDAHTVVAQILPAALKLRPVSGQLTLDEGWSPYAQVTLEADVTPEELEIIDPRNLQELQLVLARHHGSTWSLATLTGVYAGDLSALTAAYGGKPLSTFARNYSKPFNRARQRSTSIRCRLKLTSRSYDHKSGILTIEAASGEARLQALNLLDAEPYDPGTTSVRAIAELLLGRLDATLQPGDAAGTVDSAATIWKPGVSGWDYIAPLAQKAGLQLWCDHQGSWWLTEAQPMTPGTVALAVDQNPIEEIVDTISLTDDEFYDGVVIEYRWVDDAGLNQIEYDVAGPVDAANVLLVHRSTPFPGEGAAAGILTRAHGRGRRLEVTAISDYQVLPGQATRITPPATELQTGFVASVTYDLALATMKITTRGLVDTPPYSYLAAPEDLSYLDLPADLSYLDYEPGEL